MDADGNDNTPEWGWCQAEKGCKDPAMPCYDIGNSTQTMRACCSAPPTHASTATVLSVGVLTPSTSTTILGGLRGCAGYAAMRRGAATRMTTPAELVRQAQALLDELETLMRRMDPADPLSEEEPYNDFRQEQVEDLIGKAQDRLERRQEKAKMMEQTEEQAEELPVTPESAIQSQIFFLMSRRYDIAEKKRPEDAGVLEHISKTIVALEQAQRLLAELRQIKQALAVLKGVVL